MKVDINTLKGLNYDDGVKILEENGYCQNGCGAPDGAEARAIKIGECFWTDIYYTFEDEDGNEHTVSFEQEWEKGELEENNKLIREYWGEITDTIKEKYVQLQKEQVAHKGKNSVLDKLSANKAIIEQKEKKHVIKRTEQERGI